MTALRRAWMLVGLAMSAQSHMPSVGSPSSPMLAYRFAQETAKRHLGVSGS